MAVTARVELILATTNTKVLDNSTAQDALSGFPAALAANLTSGTGKDKADTIWHDRRTLAAAATENIDVYDFGGGAQDALGQSIANATVKVLYIKNRSATAGEKLTIGGEGSAAAWNSLFNGSDTATTQIGPDSTLIRVEPSAAGLAVTDVSNHLLKIANAGIASIDYDIVVIGATATS